MSTTKAFRKTGTVGAQINSVDFMGVVSFMSVFPGHDKRPSMVEIQFAASDDVEIERSISTAKDGEKTTEDELKFASSKPTLTFRAEGFNVPECCIEAIRPGNLVHLVGQLSSGWRKVDDDQYVPMMYVRIVDIITIRQAQPERPARALIGDKWHEFETKEDLEELIKASETKKPSSKKAASKKAAAVPQDEEEAAY